MREGVDGCGLRGCCGFGEVDAWRWDFLTDVCMHVCQNIVE